MTAIKSTILFFVLLVCGFLLGVLEAGECYTELHSNKIWSNSEPYRENYAMIHSDSTGPPSMFRLVSGNPYNAGECKFIAKMADDGALRVWSMTNERCPTPKDLIWGSGTAGRGVGPYRAVIHVNGNFAVRDSQNTILWQTNTGGQGVGPYTVTIQQNGKLVLRDSRNVNLWSS